MATHPRGCACGAPGHSAPPPMNLSPQRQFSQPSAAPSMPPLDIPRLSKQEPSFARSPMQMQQPPPMAGGLTSQCESPTAKEPNKLDQMKAERLQEKLDREQKEAELNRWVSHLRQFDSFASAELKRRAQEEEDFPKLKVPQLKGHHRCRVSSLLNHQVDYAIDMEKDLRNIGIQETQMLDMLEKLTRGEAAVRFQGAVRAAEVAAMSAPPELAEEAAVAGARGYTVEVQEISKSSSAGKPGENPIEIIGYIGCTRPSL